MPIKQEDIYDLMTYHKPEPEFPTPVQRQVQRVGRNAPCPCGSQKKFKKCCLGLSE